MEKITCKICGKVLEGYSIDHVTYLLLQHELTHRDKEKNSSEPLKTQNNTITEEVREDG